MLLDLKMAHNLVMNWDCLICKNTIQSVDAGVEKTLDALEDIVTDSAQHTVLQV